MSRQNFTRVFGDNGRAVIGMVTLYGTNSDFFVRNALRETEIFADSGCIGVLISNYCKTTPAARVFGVLEEISKKFGRNGSSFRIGAAVFPNNTRRTVSLAEHFGLDFIYFDYLAGIYTSGPDFDRDAYSDFRRRNSAVVVLGGVHPDGYIPVLGSKLEDDLAEGMRRADSIVVSGRDSRSLTDKVQLFDRLIGRESDQMSERYPLTIFNPDIRHIESLIALRFAEGVIVGPCVREDMDAASSLITKRVTGVMLTLSDKFYEISAKYL